jgi:hypothetical protein
MSMATPLLDEHDFDEFVAEGLALLPVYAPEWTNHNPSDPGVTLVELLAYVSDMLMYRAGRITPAAMLQFLHLLTGAARQSGASLAEADRDTLQGEIENALRQIAQVQCAVTAADFEQLALTAARRHAPVQRGILAHCVDDIDLSGNRQRAAAREHVGHVSVIVAPLDEVSAADAAKLRAKVRRYLLPRCLLTTRLHVVSPDYLYVGIGFDVALLPGVSLPTAQREIEAALQGCFGDGVGIGDDASASAPALGEPLILSHVAKVIDDVPGVDYVENVSVLQMTLEHHALAHTDASLGVQVGTRSNLGVDTRIGGPPPYYEDRLVRDSEGALASIALQPWELLRLGIAHDGIREIGRDEHNGRASQGERNE